MNTLKQFLISLIWLTICLHSANAQVFPLNTNLSIIPPYSVKLEDYKEYEINALLTIINTTNNTYTIRFDAQLIGDNGLIVNTTGNPPSLVITPFETKILSGSDIGDLYAGFTEEDFLLSGISANLYDEIIKNRALPEGNYQLCFTAIDVLTGITLTAPLSGCANFQIQYPDRPYIINPSYGQTIPSNESQEIEFYWSAPGTASQDLTLNTEYELRVIDISIYDDLDPTEAMLDPSVDFVFSEQGIDTEFFTADIPDLEIGHEYAARVTASDVAGIIPYAFDGHSEVIVFTYGEEGDSYEEDEEDDLEEEEGDYSCILADHTGEDCSSPEVELYFPPNTDTIPFDYVPFMIKFNPFCEEYKRLNYDYKLYNQENTLIDSRTDELNWGNIGPLQFLLNQGIPDVDEDRARYFMINDNATTPALERSNAYKFTSKSTMTMRDGTVHTYDVQESNFVSGMPKPGLTAPEHLETLAPGDIAFSFDNGALPFNGYPDVSSLIRMDGSSIEDNTVFGKAEEHWVLQVATTNQFEAENIVAGANEFIGAYEVNEIEELYGLLYLTNDIVKNITKEGQYYWRVVWLKEPEGSREEGFSEENPETFYLPAEEFYHSSTIRSFIIDSDADIADGNGSGTSAPETDCTTGCEVPDFVMTASSSIGEVSSFQAGYFLVQDLELSSNSGGRLTGTGVVKIAFMSDVQIKVEFDNIRLNSELRLVEGEVKAQTEDTPFNLNDINNNIATGAQYAGVGGQVNTWLEENAEEGRIVSAIASDRPIGMPFGIERDIKDHKLLIGITDFILRAKEARVKLLYEQHFEKMRTDQWLSLAGEVCIKPSGFGAEVMIHLNRDVVIEDYWEEDQDERDIKYILKGSDSSNPEEIRENSTHIEFQCACVESFALRMEAEFDEDKLVKDTESGEPGTGPVKAYFNFELRREEECKNEEDKEDQAEFLADRMKANNFMVDFTMDPFQLKGLEGWGFTVTEGYLDFSSLANPEGMKFPEGYDHAALSPPEGATSSDAEALSNTWSGFYMKEVSITAPSDFYENNADRRLKAGVQDLFIDVTGFSGEIFAENIVAFGDGEVDDCSFSIDTFELRIIQNVFREGELAGEFGIPITDENTRYEAVLAYTVPDGDDSSSSSTEGSTDAHFVALGDEDAEPDSEWGFFMSMRPKGKLNTPAFMGSIQLNDNSYVHLKYGEVPEEFVNDPDYEKERKGIALFFDGVMDFSSAATETSSYRTDDARVNAPFSFKGMQFDLEYNNKDGFDWNHSFASPQKYMGGEAFANPLNEDEEGVSGFPITITELDVTSKFGDGRCIGAELGFKISLNLMDDDDGGFEASADLGIGASYDFGRKRFLFDGVDVSCITVGAKTTGSGEGETENSGITYKGSVCFYNDEPYCGVDNVTGIAGTLTVGLPVATVELSAMFASTNGYRFWYVDGKAVANSGKIAQIGAVDLIGLNGGIYYNMRLENGGSASGDAYNSALVSSASSLHNASASTDACLSKSGFRAIPSQGSYIFKVGLALATAADHSVFNMDVGVTAAFTQGRGLTYFSIIGEGYIMADVDERADAPIKADVIIQFDKQLDRKIFHAGFAVYLDLEMGPLSLKGIKPDQRAFDYPSTGKKRSEFVNAGFHLESPLVGENTWSFKLGAPRNPGGLSADILGFLKFKIYTYFQVGNDIDSGFMDLPDLITELLDMPTEGDDENGLAGGQTLGASTASNRSYGVSTGASQGEGFILGLKAETQVDVNAFIIYATLKLALGFDINVLRYEDDSVCYTEEGAEISPIGSNGWYATGQIYAGVQGEVGLQIWFFGLRRFSLFKLGAAFLVRGGFPNPVWAEGRARIMYSVLGGLAEGTAGINFAIGEKCVPPKTDPFGFSIIAGVDPEQGASTVSPYVQPVVSFNIPMDEVLEIPEVEDILDEDGMIIESRVYTEKIKPYVSKLEVKDRVTGQAIHLSTPSRRFKEGRTIMQVNVEELLDSRQVSMHVEVKASRLEGSTWKPLSWPPASKKSGLWSEDTTVVFNTTELPDRIPEDLVKNGNPMPYQRNFLKQAPDVYSAGKLEFFRNLRGTYFVEEYEGQPCHYLIKFYDMDGNEPLVSPLKLHLKSVKFTVPSNLKNDMIYNVQIVRKAGPPSNAVSIQGYNIPDGLNLGEPLSVFKNPADEFALDKPSLVGLLDQSYKGLFNKTTFISHTRTLIPGESSGGADETILMVFPFRTSQYNTLGAKFAGAESSYAPIETNSGDISTVQHWIQIRTEEGFDQFDLLGVERKFGTQTFVRPPSVAFFPDLSTSFWTDKAAPKYESMQNFLRYNFSTYLKTGSNAEIGSYKIHSTLSEPRFVLDYGNPKYYLNFDYAVGLRMRDMGIQFNQGKVSDPKINRFRTIDPRTVYPPLSQDDIQDAWDQTVIEMAEELEPTPEEETSSSNMVILGADVGNIYGQYQSAQNGIFLNSNSNSSAATFDIEIDLRKTTRFLFDFHEKVERDMGRFKSRLSRLHYFTGTAQLAHLDTPIYLGNIQREHMKNQFPNYNQFFSQWMTTNTDDFRLENNQGTYNYKVNHFWFELGGNDIPVWGSPDIPLQFSN